MVLLIDRDTIRQRALGLYLCDALVLVPPFFMRGALLPRRGILREETARRE